MRRFRCAGPSCQAVTFTEQADGLTGRYLRRTLPLRALLAAFGLELAGRAGARLAGTLGIPVHRTTMLRLVMGVSDARLDQVDMGGFLLIEADSVETAAQIAAGAPHIALGGSVIVRPCLSVT